MTNVKFRSKREKEWVDCDWLSINAFRERKYMDFFFFFLEKYNSTGAFI